MDSAEKRVLRILVFALALIAGLWLIGELLPIVEALVVAGLLAYLLHPVTVWFTRILRIAYEPSARLVMGGLLFIVFLAPAVLGTVLWSRFNGAAESAIQVVATEMNAWLSQPIQIFVLTLSPREIVEDASGYIAELLAPLPAQSFNLLSGLSLNLFWVVLVLVCTYFLLLDGPWVKPWVLERVPAEYRPELAILLEKLDLVWRLFLRVQLLIFLILAALFALGTFLVIWLFTIGVLPFSWILFFALLIVVYAAAQQVDNLWLRPRWMGRSLDLHPGVVFASLLASLAIGGVLLAFLIVPLIATVKLLGGYIYRKLLDQPAWPDEISASEANLEIQPMEDAPN